MTPVDRRRGPNRGPRHDARGLSPGGAVYPSGADPQTDAAPEVGPCCASLAMRELEQLMQEPAGGPNHGRRASDNPEATSGRSSRSASLDSASTPGLDFIQSGGAHLVDTSRGSGGATAGARDAGMSSHAANQHTVLHPDDYVDEALLAALVEDELGFGAEQLHSVYSTGGRIPSERLGLRDRIDMRLLTLARAGSNMDLFCRITGLNGSTVDRALARARAQETSQGGAIQ